VSCRCCPSTTGKTATSRPPPSSHRWAAGPIASPRSQPGRQLVFERVKNWWGANLPVNRGQIQLRPGRGGVLPRQRRGLRSIQGRRIRHLYRTPGQKLGQWLQLPGGAPWRSDQGANAHQIPTQSQGLFMNSRRSHFQPGQGARSAGVDVRFRMDQPHPVQRRLSTHPELLPQQRILGQRHAGGS
jgi:microcin C transport system substrate-binding protein